MLPDSLFPERVAAVLEELNSVISADGYRLTLQRIDRQAGALELRLQGLASGCPSSGEGVLFLVERRLKKSFPGVEVHVR